MMSSYILTKPKPAGVVLFLLIGLLGCKKETGTINSENKTTEALAARSAAKPNSVATVSLRVTMNDLDATGGACKITGDGKGDYLNGQENVQAVLDQYGTFAFNTIASTKKPAIRWVNYNFNNPVDGANLYRPTPDNTKNFHFSTGPSSYSPFIPIQNLGINGNPGSECIYMGNGISNSTTNWRVSFHKGYEDTQSSPTCFVVVTRTGISPDIWTISPVGSCNGNTNIAALRSGDGLQLFGYYYLPFQFTLTAL